MDQEDVAERRFSLLRLLLGRRLASHEQERRRIGSLEAIPAMGLDALGSAAYGPEAALTALAPIGAAGLLWVGPITVAIVVLLGALYVSYRQTILAYQTGGGAYTVCKDNLGVNASVLAACALMLDYILNVAVGISAGVGALTSTLPVLQPWTLALCLAILVFVTLANLRGVGEAGALFALPTYLFIALFLGLSGFGVLQAMRQGGHPHPVVAPPPQLSVAAPVSLWLLMRAFAAGCTAMTGVEAVSNGVNAFKPPVAGRAHRTLTVICVTLALLLAGVAVLARAYGLRAMDQTQPGYQSILSQLTAAVVGHGAVYYVSMASLLAVLCLSANTSFVGFPRLAHLVAQDGFLPRPFASADRRLVFSVGVGFLAVTAGLLLIVFKGITDRLIPLFAIGAFLTFALSQLGMVAHWRKQKGSNGARLLVNGLGAAVTVVALVIIVLAKFLEGAWIVILALPIVFALLKAMRRYYDRLERALAVAGPFQIGPQEPPIVLVAFSRRSRVTDHAMRYALSLSDDVLAAHLLDLGGPEEPEDPREIRRRWRAEIAGPVAAAGRSPPRLVLLPAPYRRLNRPLLTFIQKLDALTPGRSVAVLIPELVVDHWWEWLLHVRRAERMRAALLAACGDRIMLITAPWRRDARR